MKIVIRREPITYEQRVNAAIAMLYEQMQKNYTGGYRILGELPMESQEWWSLKKRLDILGFALTYLQNLLKVEDGHYKLERFCKIVNSLRSILEQDLRDFELSVAFLKNINIDMAVA
ncbi:hypothetical protein KC717_03805 [Candidatus Dojkabacteria bacterium]|uniref:Uncharacterized protein n=1 Tax=Candidatus Dojkabacteria bacterium TaxID=2099670 RepID=A0A955L8P6_9BACT|nr:hypothetical protein [Candidatus Dojkabacteria bacterium]